jgi:hypothetical protein
LEDNRDCVIPRPLTTDEGFSFAHFRNHPHSAAKFFHHQPGKERKNPASELTDFVSGASQVSEAGRGIHHHGRCFHFRFVAPQGAYLDFAYGHSSSAVALVLPAVN